MCSLSPASGIIHDLTVLEFMFLCPDELLENHLEVLFVEPLGLHKRVDCSTDMGLILA